MKKGIFVVLLALTACYDFDYVKPTEETTYRPIQKDTADNIIVADTVKRRCGV